jgi:hypothetical protein
MVYQSEKYIETSYGKRSGITFGQSGLGARAAPPQNGCMTVVGLWSILFFIIWYNSGFGFGTALGVFWAGVLVVSIVYGLLGGHKKDGRKQANWANSWMCLDCGSTWQRK